MKKTPAHNLDFRLLFENSPTPFLVLLPDDGYTVVEVNQAYLDATKTERENLVGRPLFDAFSSNSEDSLATDTASLRGSLQRAVATGEMDTMAIQRYDIRRPSSAWSGAEERYWSPVNIPVMVGNEVAYIIHRVEDVTQVVQLTAEQSRDDREVLEARNEQIMAELIARGEELNQANEQLRLESRRKDEFVAMLAHELRNPLAAIGSVAELLTSTADLTPERAQHIKVLHHNLHALKDLVESLLDLSRISRGVIELKRQPVTLQETVQNALDTVDYLMREKSHEVFVTQPSDAITLCGDPVRLEQIMVNLLTNAGRYTNPGGRIRITIKVSQGEAEIVVQDNGRGLTPEMFDRIFEMFAQEERSLARSEGGLGIGLTIVKRLVELHGGNIEVHSTGIGEGAEFRLRLPLAADQARSSSAESDLVPGGRTRRVLLVEDNHDIADTLAILLERWGHQVNTAYDGASGLEAARAEFPDIVLLDIGLPGKDGYQVARELRETPGADETVLVALTGYGNDTDRQQALNAGFDEHFVKPVDLLALKTFIDGSHRAGSA